MSAEPALACCQDERDSRLRGQTPCQAMATDAAAHRWCGMALTLRPEVEAVVPVLAA